LPPDRGGRTRVGADGYLAGAPELVVEVAYSSESFDLYEKKRDYQGAGVPENVVVVLRQPRVLWFALREGAFHELAPNEDGIFRSGTFPGLWLDPAALLRLDTNAVRATLDKGVASREHSDFVKRLTG